MIELALKSRSQIESEALVWLRSALTDKTLLLLCGGSGISLEAFLWNSLTEDEQAKIRISLTDERYGPPGHANSNWKQLGDAGLKLIDPRHVAVLGQESTVEETTVRWSDQLQELLDWSTTVVAIFGIGEDAHIAGIKPRSPAAAEGSAITSCFVGHDFTRVTITPLVFKQITSAAIYALAPKKLEALSKLNEELDPVEYPSQNIKQTGSFCIFYQSEETI